MPTVTMQRAAPLVHRHLSLSHLQSDNDGLPSHILRRRLSSKRDPANESPGRGRVLALVLATFLLCVLVMSLKSSTSGIFQGSRAADHRHPQGSTGGVEVGVVSPLYLGELHTNPKHKLGSSLVQRGAADDSASLKPTSLLLASHNRVLWHDIETGDNHILHEGEGVYHGVFPGEEVDEHGQATTLWLLSRPMDWHPGSSQEVLIEIDTRTLKEVSRVRILSRSAHDAVRRGDHVYISSTADGEVIQLSMPGLKEVARFELFTPHQHVNSLAPLREDRLWALLHNMGSSDVVLVDSKEGRLLERHRGVASKAHNLVAWHSWLLLLDSGKGGLSRFHPQTAKHDLLWHADEPGMYTKGLAVIDDVAYFGLSPAQPKEGHNATTLDCELVAYDLIEGRLLWQRKVPTRGLLNVVAAPHLSEASTYAALRTSHPASLPSIKDDTQSSKLHLSPVARKSYTAQLTHQTLHDNVGSMAHVTRSINPSKPRTHQEHVHAGVTVVSDWMMEHHSRATYPDLREATGRPQLPQEPMSIGS